MKVVKPSFEILYPANAVEWYRELQLIELAGRTAYKSEDKIDANSHIDFIKKIKMQNHGAVLEFGNMVVKFITDRGITHELVRHRLCSFLQESTRYCNYSQDKFGNEITVIQPSNLSNDGGDATKFWQDSCEKAEKEYLSMIRNGISPQTARSILPTCTKTEIVVKANFREWLHIFDLRVVGKTGKPHPDMFRLLSPLYENLKKKCPYLWGEP